MANRVTCTLCGDVYESTDIKRLIEWDQAHLCEGRAQREQAARPEEP